MFYPDSIVQSIFKETTCLPRIYQPLFSNSLKHCMYSSSKDLFNLPKTLIFNHKAHKYNCSNQNSEANTIKTASLLKWCIICQLQVPDQASVRRIQYKFCFSASYWLDIVQMSLQNKYCLYCFMMAMSSSYRIINAIYVAIRLYQTVHLFYHSQIPTLICKCF